MIAQVHVYVNILTWNLKQINKLVLPPFYILKTERLQHGQYCPELIAYDFDIRVIIYPDSLNSIPFIRNITFRYKLNV